MSIHSPIGVSNEPTTVHNAPAGQPGPEPDPMDVQRFELKTAELQQQARFVPSDQGAPTPTDANHEQLMDVFYKQLTDSILKDIITRCKIDINQE